MTKTSKIRIALRTWFILSIAICAADAILNADVNGLFSAMACSLFWGIAES